MRNIAELLKDCPKGMELDCTTWENVTFEKVVNNKIFIRRNDKPSFDNTVVLNEYGCTTDYLDEKCRIFPKGKTTWEGFQRPFKDGDVVFYNDTISIFKEWGDGTLFRTHACVYLCAEILDINVPLFGKGVKREIRYATEEEKEKLFKAIKANGYKWNAETKTLEKLPKFKVGDRVKHISAYTTGVVLKVGDEGYYMDCPKNGGIRYISFALEKDYELAPNKFDITTLKPFDKVLVRDFDNETWEINLFSRLLDGKHFKCHFKCLDVSYVQCIPYEGNEHLLGTTNDCDDFYKTW